MNKLNRASKQAFTLLEIVIVMGITATLLFLIIVNVTSFLQHGRDSRRILDLQHIASALDEYKSDNDAYPCFNNNSSPACRSDVIDNLSSGFSSYVSNNYPKDPNPPASCPNYYLASSGTKYTLFARLENPNDPSALSPKPTPRLQYFGTLSGDYKTFTVGSSYICGTGGGTTFNYWLNSP